LSRTQEHLSSLQKEFPSIHCICLDLRNMERLKKDVQELPDDITLLVNNAGWGIFTSFLEVTEEIYDMTMDINVKAVLFLTQIIATKMIANGKGGSIVNVSSQLSLGAVPGGAAYCVSKGALDMLAKAMALELGPHQIRVNAINPTVVKTDIAKPVTEDPDNARPWLNRIPQGKFAEVEDVVRPIIYLLSDQSDMINGVQLLIDGGFLAGATMK